MSADGVRSRRSLRDLFLHRPAAVFVAFLLAPFAAARCRARIRRDFRKLARAEDHILRDVGLTRMQVEQLASARKAR